MKLLKQPVFKQPINKDRWLAIGLLVGVVMLASLVLIVPIASKSLELHDKKEGLLFKLEQYQRILAKKDAVVASMDAIKTQHDEQGYFNSQQTDALASAEMQNFIKKTIVDAGGQLSSTQAIPVTVKDGFSRITVRVRMTGNSEVLRAVLYKIETSTPLIIVDQIDIRPMRGRRSMTSHKIEPSNDLNVNFQAVSFMRKQPE